MSGQRRDASVRATSPGQPKAKARAEASGNVKKPKSFNACGEDKSLDGCAPKRGSRNRQSKKEKDTLECESEKQKVKASGRCKGQKGSHATNGEDRSMELAGEKCTLKQGRSINLQSKKEKDPHSCESEDKPQETPAPKRDTVNGQSVKSKSAERKIPKRQSKTEISDASVTQSASPTVSARSPDLKQKSAAKTPMRGLSVEGTVGKRLKATIEKLKIKRDERSNASGCVNNITDKVIAHLRQNTTWCADIEMLPTGSYYENVKICEPDEFDVMLTIPVERVDIQEFDAAGAFYSIALKRHPNKHPLDIFLNEDKTIQASEMLNEFRDAVKKAVEKLPYKIVLQRKKARCPAVTLEITEKGKTISVDFVLGLKVHRVSWPDFTKDGFKIENWLGKKEKAKMKQQPFYLVPKYEGRANAEHDGVVAKDAWRISFSHVEKEILKNHGHSKTCCEAGGTKCCRKECLKLLKYLLQQLKEDDTKSNKMSNFCSYHAKTTLLHACSSRGTDSEWAYSQLADCFQQLLEDFVKHLRKRHLSNFFIPSQNLLHNASSSSCDFLATEIEFQFNNDFPLFG